MEKAHWDPDASECPLVSDTITPMETNDANQPAEQPRRREALVALIVLVAVIAAAFFAYQMLAAQAHDSQPETRTTTTESSRELPKLSEFDATVYTESDEGRLLTEIADGKPLVMNFWATWCPYCVNEMGDYQEIYDEYGDRVSFAFIDVADGKRETVQKASDWLADNGYRLPAYYDTSLNAMYKYGATNLPTTVIVARNGDILDVSAGAIDPKAMRSTLTELVEE